jgi:hypothetical protein
MYVRPTQRLGKILNSVTSSDRLTISTSSSGISAATLGAEFWPLVAAVRKKLPQKRKQPE